MEERDARSSLRAECWKEYRKMADSLNFITAKEARAARERAIDEANRNRVRRLNPSIIGWDFGKDDQTVRWSMEGWD